MLFPDPGLRRSTHGLSASPARAIRRPSLTQGHRPGKPPGLELAPFQRDGYERARVIARRHGGVVYADGVGTGKTEIGLAFIEERTKEDGVFALAGHAGAAQGALGRAHPSAKLPAQVISFQRARHG